MTSFSPFSALPTELRLHIWSIVPEPTRLVGLLPVADAGPNRRPRSRSSESESTSRHQFRHVVQPRSAAAVFPPLHTCRESREVWLQKVVRTPRCCVAQMTENNEDDGASYSVQFCMPFLSYASDVFTVFDAWGFWDFAGLPGYPLPQHPDEEVYADPFVGLDRSQIQHLGICEIPYGLEGAVKAMKIQGLPKLQRLSFLTLGPESGHGGEHQMEMSVHHMQKVDCELRNIAGDKVETSEFLNHARLRHPFGLSPAIRPLPQYAAYVKSLLWHMYPVSGQLDWSNSVVQRARNWEFVAYVTNGDDNAICPLCPGHTREELLNWEPGFHIDYKILYATGTSPVLMENGLL